MLRAEQLFTAWNILGEGLFTLNENEICWFDILGENAYHLYVDKNKVEPYKLDYFLCCAGQTTGEEIVTAGLKGLTIVDEKFRIVKELFLPPFNTNYLRFNDGKIGPDGAFWTGIMSHEGNKPVGRLLRAADGISAVLEGMIIPNGLGWSPDQKTMYITDTGYSKISQWDFDSETGRIVNERKFVDASDMEGVPDGLSVDVNGNVWSAFWGGGKVVGFSPSGDIISEISVKAANPTNCCFCGQDYSSLFITSARYGLTDPGPSDGALFKVDTGTAGTIPYKFKY